MKVRRMVRKRRRYPGECANAATAIRSHCIECCGYSTDEVEKCTAPACWLYPWRFGRNPNASARRGKDVDGSPDAENGTLAGYGAQRD